MNKKYLMNYYFYAFEIYLYNDKNTNMFVFSVIQQFFSTIFFNIILDILIIKI